MKKLLLSLLAILFISIALAQNVGIGTTTPDSSAQLDVSSTTKGFLPPRMTVAQRNAIPNPVTGLMIWCIDCDELQVYNGTDWVNMVRGTACIYNVPSVVICNKTWTLKNLNVSTYRNGDPIPKVTDNAAWAALTTGAYCYYNNDSATYAVTYGKLYNWYAVNDPRGLAPAGWHVPSDAEWNILVKCLDPLADTLYCNICNVAGGPMKETGTAHWIPPNTGATNSSGFTGLPNGYRFFNGSSFGSNGLMGHFWSSTVHSAPFAWYRFLFNTGDGLYGDFDYKTYGFSVRCLRD